MKKLWICLILLLVGLLAMSCTGGGDTADTTLPTDTNAPTEAPSDTSAEVPTEEATEEETTEAPFDPLTFEPAELPAANVAGEGFAMASECKNDRGYSNLALNDGDRSTGFSTPWEVNQSASTSYSFFIDLTAAKKLEYVKLYPMAGDEGGFPKAFDILVSADGADYTTVATVTDASAEAAKKGLTVELGGVEARFVKLLTRELGEGEKRKGKYLALSEFEVYAPIDTASNMILNRHDIWLFKNPDTTQKLEVLYYRDGAAVDSAASLRFKSMDESVASVDETGLITPVGYGKTDVYVTDGKHLAVCRVEVKEEVAKDVRISTFYHSVFAYPEQHAKGLDVLVAAGIEYIEDTSAYDRVGNVVAPYMLHLCVERGLMYSLNDPEGGSAFLNMRKDEDILAVVQKYENRAGFMGIYLRDEPHEEYTQYARVFRVIQEYNPHLTPHLNLLPPYNFGGTDEYFTEFAAVAGGNGRMRYLSYDHYPFMWGGGFNPQIYSSINRLRKAGLFYNADTGYYLQAMVITGAYREMSDTDLMYNASLGIAYGMKNFKWFVALTPVNSGEAFTTGLVAPDFTPSSMHAGVTAANKYIKTVGTVLGNSDAIEVYHSLGEMDNPALPSDFVFTLTKKSSDFIFSLYQSLDGSGQQHVVITNKKFTANGAVTVTLKANRQGDFKILDLATGEMKPLTVGADGTFTLDLAAGQCAVIELPADWDVSRPAETAENLALGKPVYVSSSAASFWEKGVCAAYFLTDGTPDNGYWLTHQNDRQGWAKLDLTQVCDVSRIVISSNSHLGKAQSLRDFTVLISEDGVNFTEVSKYDGYEWGDGVSSLEVTFDTAKVRYVLIRTDTKRPMGIGEIEVYG